MDRTIKQRSKKAGLPPGALIHIGDRQLEKVKITLISYDESKSKEEDVGSVDECLVINEEVSVTWINIEGIHEVEVLEKLGNCFGLHPLVMEDILNTDQRPKMEDFGDYVYIVLKMLHYDETRNEVVPEQVSLVLGEKFLISFQEGIEGDNFRSVRDRIRNEKGRMRRLGADYLAYTLIDAIVDNYFLILEGLGGEIEVLEEELIVSPAQETLHKIHGLKREMIYLRKSVWPLREVVSALERGESALIKDYTRVYLKDVYDHTIQVIDTVETFRDMLSGMLDIYLSSISNKMNEVMKVLTIIATIFIPLTFIAGVYGMNFKHMPELGWHFGYYAIWVVMVMMGIAMLIYFRKKRWL